MNNNINTAALKGKVTSGLKKLREDTYEFELSIKRFSGVYDKIKVIFDKNDFEYETIDRIDIGNFLGINGCFMSYNKWNPVEQRYSLHIRVFAKEIVELPAEEYLNDIHVEGILTKNPIARKTPLKGIDIVDAMVHNIYEGNHSFAPIVVWGDTTQHIKNSKKGDFAIVKGRFQSREYQKQYGDGTVENKTAYEIAAYYVEIIEIHPNANIF